MSWAGNRDFWVTALVVFIFSFLATASIWPDEAARRVATFVKAYNAEMAK